MAGKGIVTVVRPFPLIGLSCSVVAAILCVLSLSNSAWVTAENFSLSLWEMCKMKSGKTGGQWDCVDARSSDWKVATIVLMFLGLILTLVAVALGLWSVCKSSHKFLKVIAGILCVAVLLQITALILYPVRFVEDSVLHSYHEFSWGYGVAWGSTIFLVGAAVFYFLKPHDYRYSQGPMQR
ncbi:transmembrane protein 47-like [Lampetra fluviatilis]